MEISRSQERLVSTVEFPILVWRHFVLNHAQVMSIYNVVSWYYAPFLLIISSPEPAREGKIWGIFCDFKDLDILSSWLHWYTYTKLFCIDGVQTRPNCTTFSYRLIITSHAMLESYLNDTAIAYRFDKEMNLNYDEVRDLIYHGFVIQ